MMTKWEVWLASVRFDDSKEIKTRPVVIYEDKIAYIISFKVTSHEPRKNFIGEYQLKNWKAAGLKKKSVVRLHKKLKMYESDFIKKIGDLDDCDIFSICQLLRFYNKL